MLVSEIMTHGAETIGPDDTLEAAARRMRDVGVGALAVCEEGRPVGILTDRDLVVRGVAAGHSPAETPVRLAMTAQLATCRDDEDLDLAAMRMEALAVRRLVVVDPAGRLLGMLSVDDVALHSNALAGEILEQSRAPERPVHRGPWPFWEEPA
ncbi:MAG TPA: CBS domain-containing protein [Anaeromyxobacteraceae bacterium]|nr:CBS domain-containing protein [Anaeromyxobacteraceae bacterium]